MGKTKKGRRKIIKKYGSIDKIKEVEIINEPSIKKEKIREWEKEIENIKNKELYNSDLEEKKKK